MGHKSLEQGTFQLLEYSGVVWVEVSNTGKTHSNSAMDCFQKVEESFVVENMVEYLQGIVSKFCEVTQAAKNISVLK